MVKIASTTILNAPPPPPWLTFQKGLEYAIDQYFDGGLKSYAQFTCMDILFDLKLLQAYCNMYVLQVYLLDDWPQNETNEMTKCLQSKTWKTELKIPKRETLDRVELVLSNRGMFAEHNLENRTHKSYKWRAPQT